MTAATAEALPELDLPRVEGRHRNRVLAIRRRDRAVQLVTEGMTYQQVADHMGYSNRGTVHRIVHQALQRQEVKDVEFRRDVVLVRLDAFLRALWPRIDQGDVAAVRVALRIEDLRCRLLGLFADAPGSKVTEGFGRCGRPNTVVVHADCIASGCPDHWLTGARDPGLDASHG